MHPNPFTTKSSHVEYFHSVFPCVEMIYEIIMTVFPCRSVMSKTNKSKNLFFQNVRDEYFDTKIYSSQAHFQINLKITVDLDIVKLLYRN